MFRPNPSLNCPYLPYLQITTLTPQHLTIAGTRLMGGKDAASPRYVFTKLEVLYCRSLPSEHTAKLSTNSAVSVRCVTISDIYL